MAAAAMGPGPARRRHAAVGAAAAGDTASVTAGGWRWAAYELVLRRLSADDHLCTALACRTFRDIIVHTLTSDTGSKKSKKKVREPRFKTPPRAVACSAGRLQWARGLGEGAPMWLRRWDSITCRVIARHGCVAALRWARTNGRGCSCKGRQTLSQMGASFLQWPHQGA